MRAVAPRQTSHTYSDSRPVKQESLYGSCESGTCDRRARGECPSCHGQYCLAHRDHPEHAS